MPLKKAHQLVRIRDLQRLALYPPDDNANGQRANLYAGLESTLNIVNNEIKYKAKIIKKFGDLTDVKGLSHQLNQVFMNLLVNAPHVLENRGASALLTRTENNRAWAEISDTGHGIAPEHLNKIFAPFFTTNPIGRRTGLGLSISYSTTRKYLEKIRLNSQLGQDSTFRIIFPITGAIIENA